jgi:uncharacterized protein
MHFSKYTILSRPLTGSGYILMNGLSGALDWVPNEIGDALDIALHPRNETMLRQVAEALSDDLRAAWKERGHLTEAAPQDETELVKTLGGAMHDAVANKPTFMIVPNLDCNYRCTYCFERPIQNALKRQGADIAHHKGNVVMTEDQVDAVYAGISQLKAGKGLQDGGQIILYGGEPLDRNHRDVVEKIVRTGQARGYHFACITNGHDLDAFMHLLGTRGLEQVQISIDGPKEVHDKRRVYIGRESSFDRIEANIDTALAETDAEIQIRVHVDPSNIDLFDTILEFFREKGWTNNSQVIIYANTVYDKDEDGNVLAEIDHGDIVTAIGDRCAPFDNVYTSAPAIHAANAMRPAFLNGERFSLKGTYCSANSGNYIFAADGRIYACWESVGKACSRIGAFDNEQGLVLNKAATDRWFNRNVSNLPDCQHCRYALVCGGGCAQYAEYNSGDLYQAYCDDFDRTFRAGLADQARRLLREHDHPAAETHAREESNQQQEREMV